MKFILKSFVIYMVFTSNALAYIDPGIGSIILQGIIASIAAVGVFFSSVRRNIYNFFCKLKKFFSKETKNDTDK